MAENDIVEPADNEGGLNQKLDYPLLLLYQMQKITQSFSTGNIQGGIFIIKLMESSCSFKLEDGWKKEIDKLDLEFRPKVNKAREKLQSMYPDVVKQGQAEDTALTMDYWLRRFDILMCLNKMRNMLYKETETGYIK
jgi:hypothetical protein